MTDALFVSASELARRIRSRTTTSRATVEAHLAQIRSVNPELNAVVYHRQGEALAEADAADEMVRTLPPHELPPLHGVPCTIKECLALEGMPNTAGLVSRRGTTAARDAVTVARVRKAGAIPLGVTNTSELCMWMESNNYVYGRTNNPYDRTRIVGGSSGGEGAIISAGGSPFGLGSDIGGSIRMPAFFNGVFGHKPSSGLIPGTGQFPMAGPRAHAYLTTGPLCRRAEDLMPLLRVLAGPDGEDHACQLMPLGEPEKVELSKIRVLNFVGTPRHPVSAELVSAQQRAVRALVNRGAWVENVTFPAFEHAFEIWSSMLTAASGRPFLELMGQGRRVSPSRELIKWVFRRSEFTAMTSLLALSEALLSRFSAHRARMIELGNGLREELAHRLGDNGILVLPSFVRTAPNHNHPLMRQLLLRMDFAYSAILNVMELPVTQIPLGLSAEGLPMGIQVAAGHGHDHLSIAAALALEESLGGWQPPACVPPEPDLVG